MHKIWNYIFIFDQIDFIKTLVLRISPKSGRTSPALPEEGGWGVPNGTPYSPHTLDGWLGAGQHRTFLPFSSYMVSQLYYFKKTRLRL